MRISGSTEWIIFGAVGGFFFIFGCLVLCRRLRDNCCCANNSRRNRGNFEPLYVFEFSFCRAGVRRGYHVVLCICLYMPDIMSFIILYFDATQDFVGVPAEERTQPKPSLGSRRP